MVDDLDLTGVLAKAKSGALASPSDVLMAIRSAWQAVHASNVATNRLDAEQSASAAAVASESRLADALLHVHQCWLEEHLAGTVVDEDDFTAHVVAVNYKCVKTAFTSMANWSQRNTWEGFVPAVKEMREHAAAKAEGPFRTYAQIETAITRMTAEAAAAARADEDEDDPELFLADLEHWVHEKWAENGLPELKALTSARGGANKPGRRDKRARYKEASSDEDEDDDDDESKPGAKKAKTDDGDLNTEKGRTTDDGPQLVSIAPGVQLGGPLPAGAAVCTTTPNAAVVKVKCHELQATVMVVRPQVAPTEASAFEVLPPPPPPSPPPTPPHSSGDAPDGRPAPASPFGGEPEFAPPPPAPESRYVGPPTTLKVLTVAGVAANESTTRTGCLADARAFEAHAFEVSQHIESAGGAPAKRLDPPTSSTSDATNGGENSPDYFRANAFVYEREGVWTRFYAFEARLVAAAAGAMAVTSETPSTKVVDGLSIPGARAGAVGGHVVGSAASARAARGDMEARFEEMRARAVSPAGLARAATLRTQIKALDVELAELNAVVARVAGDAASFGKLGRVSRRRRGVSLKRDSYGGYCDVVDRAIAVTGEAFAPGEEKEARG